MVRTCDRCHMITEGFDEHQFQCPRHTLCYQCSRGFAHWSGRNTYDCEECFDTWRYSEYVSKETIRFFFAKSARWRKLFVECFDLGFHYTDVTEFTYLLVEELRHSEKRMGELRAAMMVEAERKDTELREKNALISDLQRRVCSVSAENDVLRADSPDQVNTSMDIIRTCGAEILRLSTDLREKEEKVNSSLDQIGTCEARIFRLSTDLREKEEKVNSSLGKIETCEAEILRLATVLRKKESIWRAPDRLRSLAESIHGTFRCVFCHDFPRTIVQCMSCRNVAACEGCLPAFLAGRAICPLDATTDLADEKNRVLLTLPRGVIDLSEITTSILYSDDEVIPQVGAQNVGGEEDRNIPADADDVAPPDDRH